MSHGHCLTGDAPGIWSSIPDEWLTDPASDSAFVRFRMRGKPVPLGSLLDSLRKPPLLLTLWGWRMICYYYRALFRQLTFYWPALPIKTVGCNLIMREVQYLHFSSKLSVLWYAGLHWTPSIKMIERLRDWSVQMGLQATFNICRSQSTGRLMFMAAIYVCSGSTWNVCHHNLTLSNTIYTFDSCASENYNLNK